MAAARTASATPPGGLKAAAPQAKDPALNSATWVTAGSLIALQQQADGIDLSRTRSARAQLAGNHLSRFRGRGMDYQESRLYQAGDDIRNMDWRVTARSGKPHVKLYQEERERPVVLFMDFNPGMFFGSCGVLKSVVSARAAALVAWAAAAQGDRIGGMLFNGKHCELPPRGGKHGVLRLIRSVVEFTEPKAGVLAQPGVGGLNAALGRLRRVARPGSLIVLLSDFYGIDGDTGKHLTQLRQHSDVAAVQIFDPLEEAPPPAARYGVTSGGVPGILDTRSAATRSAYEGYFRAHHLAVADTMRKRAIPLLRLSTVVDIAGALRRYFGEGGMARPSERLAA